MAFRIPQFRSDRGRLPKDSDERRALEKQYGVQAPLPAGTLSALARVTREVVRRSPLGVTRDAPVAVLKPKIITTVAPPKKPFTPINLHPTPSAPAPAPPVPFHPTPSTPPKVLIASSSFAPSSGGGGFSFGGGGGIAGTLGSIAGGIIGAAIPRITDRIFGSGGGGAAPPPPFPSGFQAPQPEGILTRIGQRIVPGGKTGRELTPATDLTDRVGRPIAVHPFVRESVVGPPGYVMVDMPNGQRVAMLRGFAIRAGLYRSPPKPPVSGWDLRAIRRAASATKRVKKLSSKVGLKCVKR